MDYKHCLIWDGISYRESKLGENEARNLLNASNSWMLRNIYDWDCNEETNFWAIINDRNWEISELPPKVRNQVRRCLKDCDIRIISNEELVKYNGYKVFVKSFERYHDITINVPERTTWEKCTLNDKIHEYWGVFEKESSKLIAFAMNSRIGDTIGYNTLKAIPEFLNKHYPYYGLLFEMNRHYLGEENVKFVSDGFRSITEHSNIQPFLEKNFLFRKAYCRMRLYYKSWMRLAINLSYPFRNVIPIKQIQHILRFEAINRGKL